MKCCRLVKFGQPLELSDQPDLLPTGDEVLVKITACGICHSDLHLMDGGYDAGRGTRLYAADRGVRLPVTLGHEIVGRPVSVGASSSLREDMEYLIYPWIGCGTCTVCLAGDENLCARPRTLGIYRDGGFAEYLLVPHERYLLPLDGIEAVSAAPYACSGLTTYSALMKAGQVPFQQPIVLFGAGGLGLMSLRLLQTLGARAPVVVDIDANKRAGAMQAGALATVDGAAADALDQILHYAGAQPRVVIDFVGSEGTADLAFKSLAKGGKLICVGLFGGAAPWPLPLIPMRAITIQGNYVGNLSELANLLDLVRSAKIAPIPIALTSLHQANESIGKLRRGEIPGRAVIVPFSQAGAA
jgi:propanol-preferring alcohol dehydrogenase